MKLQICLLLNLSLTFALVASASQVNRDVDPFTADMIHESRINKMSLQTVTNWGVSSCGVRLAIDLETNVVTAGSGVRFFARVQNSSTNNIRLSIKRFTFNLTNSSGKSYQLFFEGEGGGKRPESYVNMTLGVVDVVVAGQTTVIEWYRDIWFGKEIRPGNYVIQAIKREFKTSDGKVCEIISNSLKVKVLKQVLE
jgi:hypothetical protein